MSEKEQHTLNRKSELHDELIEERLLQVLSWNNGLPYADLKTRATAVADDRAFRRVLNELIVRGLVRRKADRSQRPVVSRVREGAASGLRGKPR